MAKPLKLEILLFVLITLVAHGIQISPIGYAQVDRSRDGWSIMPAVSADRYIAFATNLQLSDDDTNQLSDIYVLDSTKGLYERISEAPGAEQSTGASFHPGISGNGRYIVFATLGDNMAAPFQAPDNNHLADVYIYDRELKVSRRISLAPGGEDPIGWSHQPSISADGRYIAFTSTAGNLLPSDEDSLEDIFLFDTLDNDTVHVSRESKGGASQPVISADSRFIAYLVNADSRYEIWTFDRVSETSKTVSIDGITKARQFSGPSISADGRFISWTSTGLSGVSIYLHNYYANETTILPNPVPSIKIQNVHDKPGLSSDGSYLLTIFEHSPYLYQRESAQWEKIDLGDEVGYASLSQNARYMAYTPHRKPAEAPASLVRTPARFTGPLLSGWIINGSGTPLSNVPINYDSSSLVRTRLDGSYIIENLSQGGFSITPALKGFKFSPESRRINTSPGSAYALTFSAFPEGILEAARDDIGMPYGLNRGCPSNVVACGGPFSGYYSGDCTDLVIDAYLSGIDHNIQTALAFDALNHPEHYYRWSSARNAHDMWRYFVYTGQLLPTSRGFHPGDIVFFDWERDGIVDHVAIVSAAGNNGIPQSLIDATGITRENPSGLAIELDWQAYHTQAYVGHTRWTGSLPARSTSAPAEMFLNIALDSTHAEMRLINKQGRAISSREPALPGETYLSTSLGEVISLPITQTEDQTYTIEIKSQKSTNVQIGLRIIQSGQTLAIESTMYQVQAAQTLKLTFQIQSGGLSAVIVPPE